MIVYDKQSLESTGRYEGVFEAFNFTGMNIADKFYPLATVQSHILVGMVDFSSSISKFGIDF
jgi:hypothetical protein